MIINNRKLITKIAELLSDMRAMPRTIINPVINDPSDGTSIFIGLAPHWEHRGLIYRYRYAVPHLTLRMIFDPVNADRDISGRHIIAVLDA
jgi:hypothetical protein